MATRTSRRQSCWLSPCECTCSSAPSVSFEKRELLRNECIRHKSEIKDEKGRGEELVARLLSNARNRTPPPVLTSSITLRVYVSRNRARELEKTIFVALLLSFDTYRSYNAGGRGEGRKLAEISSRPILSTALATAEEIPPRDSLS